MCACVQFEGYIRGGGRGKGERGRRKGEGGRRKAEGGRRKGEGGRYKLWEGTVYKKHNFHFSFPYLMRYDSPGHAHHLSIFHFVLNLDMSVWGGEGV